VAGSNGDASGPRPRRLVAVIGTGTDVGKTWVSARLLERLRREGFSVAARKPAQSFDPSDDPSRYDASVLGAATGEAPEAVCPRNRWYEAALAPPMAADVLGRPPFTVDDLVGELHWPDAVDVGLVETAGGLRSPIAEDGDCLALVKILHPDLIVLVADAGLGTINAVRLTTHALEPPLHGRVAVVLNRFVADSDLHRRNLSWLADQDALRVLFAPGQEKELTALARGGPTS
jgi:dethiobiotin synthetase